MKLSRLFTRDHACCYDGVEFESRSSRISNPDGSVVFEARDIQVPKGWSQVAVDILAQKYFRKAGIPARLRRVPEPGVPEWLWRREADEAALALRAEEAQNSRLWAGIHFPIDNEMGALGGAMIGRLVVARARSEEGG